MSKYMRQILSMPYRSASRKPALSKAFTAFQSRAIREMPRMASAHANLVVCFVGAGEIEKAKAAFRAGQPIAPEYFRERMAGNLPLAQLEHRVRVQTFLRIAAGLEDPSAAEPLR